MRNEKSSMEENVRKEVETIKGMVVTWKDSYLKSIKEGGGGEFLAQDLLKEIDEHVSPYVRRLYECQYIDRDEVKEVMDFCYRQVQDLRDALKEEG